MALGAVSFSLLIAVLLILPWVTALRRHAFTYLDGPSPSWFSFLSMKCCGVLAARVRRIVRMHLRLIFGLFFLPPFVTFRLIEHFWPRRQARIRYTVSVQLVHCDLELFQVFCYRESISPNSTYGWTRTTGFVLSDCLTTVRRKQIVLNSFQL